MEDLQEKTRQAWVTGRPGGWLGNGYPVPRYLLGSLEEENQGCPTMGAQDEGQIGATVCPALDLSYISAEMAASLWPLCLHDFTPLLAFPQTASSDRSVPSAPAAQQTVSGEPQGPMGAGRRRGLPRGSGITAGPARVCLPALAMAAVSLLSTLATRLLRPAQSCRLHHRPFHLSAVR